MPNNAEVSFTADAVLEIVNSLGNAAIAINPAASGAVAAITGIAVVLRSTVLPAIQHLQAHEITLAEQMTLSAESAAERARVGAPPAQIN